MPQVNTYSVFNGSSGVAAVYDFAGHLEDPHQLISPGRRVRNGWTDHWSNPAGPRARPKTSSLGDKRL